MDEFGSHLQGDGYRLIDLLRWRVVSGCLKETKLPKTSLMFLLNYLLRRKNIFARQRTTIENHIYPLSSTQKFNPSLNTHVKHHLSMKHVCSPASHNALSCTPTLTVPLLWHSGLPASTTLLMTRVQVLVGRVGLIHLCPTSPNPHSHPQGLAKAGGKLGQLTCIR